MNQGMVICYPLICIIPTLYRSYSPECQAKTLPLHIVIDMNMGIDNLNIVEVLIAEKESGRVEFKETTGQLERGMETLCAFLNGEGGTVLFGVNDKGKIIGQEVSDKTKRDIADAINRLEPVAAVQISYAPIPNSEKKVIAFRVENSKNNRPFSYKGRPYMRVESATTTMPQATYNDLLLQRDGNQYRWELLENRDLTLQDLDVNEVLKTVRLGIECGRLPEDTGTDVPVILEKFGLQKNGVLNNAAAVLFGKHERMEYPQCLLRLARFKGTDKTVFMDSQRIHGNFFQLLNVAMAFIFKHLSLSGTTDTLEREEHLTIPYKAIREGVVNSLTHRSYKEAGGSVGIAIYDDRVEIENSGTFPPNWDAEKMKSEHESKPQNPLLANVLYKRKVLESWGRGIGLMMSECRKAGLPEPEYKIWADSVTLIFRCEVSNRPSTDQAPTKHRPSTDQVFALVKVLNERELSVKEIMEALELNHRPTFRINYLHPALNEGYIIPLYPEQPSHPKQKYRLTEKGLELLKQQ